MAIPNMLAHVESCAKKYPDAWKHAHIKGDPRSHEFIKLLAIDVHAGNQNFGLNGKRGNPKDLSADCLNFHGAGPGRTPEGEPCNVIDVIKDAGLPTQQPVWQVFTDPEAASGAWVDPTTVDPVPAPVPPSLNFPPRDWVGRFFAALDDLYRSKGRKNRTKSGEPLHVDNEGIFVWVPEFLRLCANGQGEGEATMNVLMMIEAAWPKPDSRTAASPGVGERKGDEPTTSADATGDSGNSDGGPNTGDATNTGADGS